jgi:hypothetical protein
MSKKKNSMEIISRLIQSKERISKTENEVEEILHLDSNKEKEINHNFSIQDLSDVIKKSN